MEYGPVVDPIARWFEPRIDQVSAARGFARSTVKGWRGDHEAVGLVVSELATNAVVHARSPFKVALSDEGDRVRVEVSDNDPRPPAECPPPNEGVSGRGLLIVKRLATAWGVRPGSPGKIVWAEVRVQERR
jgi:anti-sigma regulatory factor (Ser/Thr protein kinase)